MATDDPKIRRDGPSVYEQANPPPHDRWARRSFTFRRMQPWNIWALSIAILVLAVLAALWLMR